MFKFIKDIFKDTTTGLYCLIRVILSASLILVITYFSFTYLSNVFVNDEVYDGSSFHSVPEDTMDIIVLGSSHTQYSYVPAYMYQQTGLYSYSLGSACQPIRVSYQMLKEAYKTQNPELVILEVFTGTPQAVSCAGDSCYVMAAYQMTGEEKFNVINMLPKEKAETYHNDFINNHNKWKGIETISELTPKTHNYYSYSFGYIDNYFQYASNFWYSSKYYDSDLEVNLKREDLEALNNIKKLCDSNNSELLLYMVPIDSITEEDQAYRYEIWKWAENNGVKYQDYSQNDEIIDYRLCIHSDGCHSFLNGAGLITNQLAKFIIDNYEFTSHTYNKEIEEANTNFMTDYSYVLYSTEENPEIYLEEIKNYKGTYIFRYTPGQEMTESLINKIKELGFENFDPNNTYYAIMNNNTVISEGNDFAQTTIQDQELFVDYNQILQNNNSIKFEGTINFVIFNTNLSLNVVKNIEKVKPDWWNNGKDYWEYGYDMYYNKIEN